MRNQTIARWWQARRADVAVLAAIVGAFLAAFGWAIFRGKFLLGGDVFFYTYPMRTLAWRMIRHGALPLWTPNVLSGYPLLAMVQLGFGYPLTWFHLFLPNHWAEEIYVLAPFVLAPAFTYAYAREVGRTRLAALMAGLAYGYSGVTTNSLGMNGLTTNAVLWLPLLLIALERSRKNFIWPLIGAAGAYSLSVLTGQAQGFLIVGVIGVAYALFLVLARSISGAQSWSHRLRPIIVVAIAYVIAFGIGSFQILETLRAARRSIRSAISYDFFSQGSLTLREATLSYLIPLFHYTDATTYVAPVSCALGLYGIALWSKRQKLPDPRPWFWFVLAVGAFVYMLGDHTPLYRLVYHIPILNWFRVPSRQSFAWCFALSILGAFGWDVLTALRERSGTAQRSSRIGLVVNLPTLLTLCGLIGLLWWLSVNRINVLGLLPVTTTGRMYLVWKIVFTVCVFASVWIATQMIESRQRQVFLASLLVLGCMVEPLILISQWWPGTAKPARRFNTPAQATRYVQQFPPEQNRVYYRANLGIDENSDNPRVDVLNQPAMFGIQNAGGYEQLLMRRYSRALGDVDYDAVRPLPGHEYSQELFQSKSHVLDLLNVTQVVAPADSNEGSPQPIVHHDGFDFAAADLLPELKARQTVAFNAADARGDELMLVTSLANSVSLGTNSLVARLRVQFADGQVVDRDLLAGRDTAEWAYERADVRPLMKHSAARVFDARPGDAGNSFPAQRYLTRVPLGTVGAIRQIEIANTTESATLSVWKITIVDPTARSSTPLGRPALDPQRWQLEADFDGVIVLRNTRALPRAWLVGEMQPTDAETALKQIRGLENQSFDPKRTALVEVAAGAVPQLSGGDLSVTGKTRISLYEPRRLVIETDAPTAGFLVTSEIFYPGWEATVDGRPAPIFLTNYLLRGVLLPPGSHRVEMVYRSPAVRNGAIISSCTLLLWFGLVIFAGRDSVRRRTSNHHEA